MDCRGFCTLVLAPPFFFFFLINISKWCFNYNMGKSLNNTHMYIYVWILAMYDECMSLLIILRDT